MLETLGIVLVPSRAVTPHARPGTHQLVRRHLAGKPLLEWLVRRMTEAQRLDGVIVVLGQEERELVPLVPLDAPVFVSAAADPLGRAAEALREFPCRAAVWAGLDSPLIDPELIDRLVAYAQTREQPDYVGFGSAEGVSARERNLGVVAEWTAASAVLRAAKEASHPLDRMFVTRYLRRQPDRFTAEFLHLPPRLQRDDMRLVLGQEADWEHLESICEALDPERLDWRGLADLLDQQPGLRRQMAALNASQSED